MEDQAESYSALLADFSEAWINVEIKHHISKTASNALFDTAIAWIPRLHHAKVAEMKTSASPKFVSLRKKIYDTNVPEIKLETAYEDNETGEEMLVESNKTVQFNPRRFNKIYEVASVQVI